MIKEGKELNDVVCTAYRMGCDQTREVYQKRVEELEASESEWQPICDSYAAENQRLSDRIEKLEAVLEVATMKRIINTDRIEKLEAVLREMLSKCAWEKRGQWCGSLDCHCRIARKVLEGKDGNA